MVLHIVANRPHLVDLFEQFIYDVSASICTHPSRSHIDRHFSKAAVRATPGRFTEWPCLESDSNLNPNEPIVV